VNFQDDLTYTHLVEAHRSDAQNENQLQLNSFTSNLIEPTITSLQFQQTYSCENPFIDKESMIATIITPQLNQVQSSPPIFYSQKETLPPCTNTSQHSSFTHTVSQCSSSDTLCHKQSFQLDCNSSTLYPPHTPHNLHCNEFNPLASNDSICTSSPSFRHHDNNTVTQNQISPNTSNTLSVTPQFQLQPPSSDPDIFTQTNHSTPKPSHVSAQFLNDEINQRCFPQRQLTHQAPLVASVDEVNFIKMLLYHDF